MYYTYVLSCKEAKTNKTVFYVGFSSDLRNRIKAHMSKSSQFTKNFHKIELVYYEACLNKRDARIRELQLKTGFGRGYIKRRLENYLKKVASVVSTES